MKMVVPPSALENDDNDDTALRARGESRDAPIAVVGAGPAGLTCATYLSRLGYRNLTLYEARQYAGGLR